MPYTKCPTCGVVAHCRVASPSTWYAERYPELPFGSTVPLVCFFCSEELSPGSSVFIRSNFTEQPEWAVVGKRGTVTRVASSSDGVFYVVKFDNGKESFFLRGELRRPYRYGSTNDEH